MKHYNQVTTFTEIQVYSDKASDKFAQYQLHVTAYTINQSGSVVIFLSRFKSFTPKESIHTSLSLLFFVLYRPRPLSIIQKTCRCQWPCFTETTTSWQTERMYSSYWTIYPTLYTRKRSQTGITSTSLSEEMLIKFSIQTF